MKVLPAAVLEASKQRAKVRRLVEYCRELDGTEVKIIELPPEIDATPHPVGVERAVRHAGPMFDEPWIYLEADSIPLRAGWREALTKEYYDSGKLFMLPDLEGCPFYDVASAIGVWPPNLQNYLPDNIHKPPWFDLHIYKNHADKLHLTKQIMHRYGVYQGHRVLRRYEFPRDLDIITPEAVVFHADPTQSIIRGGLKSRFYHSGDLGDIIAALPIIKQQGGGGLVIGPDHTHKRGRVPRVGMNLGRYRQIAPLLHAQPYLLHVGFTQRWKDCGADRDLSTFRMLDKIPGENLADWQGRYLGRVELDLAAWLTVPDAPWNGRVAVSRSTRYHNHLFPWKAIAEKFGDQMLFVGLPDEHKAFCQLTGRQCERAVTRDLLEVAKVLNGALVHFANQSCPAWITMAMGKNIVMEVYPPEKNSIVRNCPLSIFAETEADMQQIAETYL